MQLLQRGTRFDAKLGRPACRGSTVLLQRLGGPPRLLQREHVLARDPLVRGVLAAPGGQVHHQVLPLAEPQPEIDEVVLGGQPFQRQPAAFGFGPLAVDAEQRGAVPQRQRLGERSRGIAVVGRGTGATGQQPVPVQVDQLGLVDGQCVATRAPVDAEARHRGERLAQPGDVAVHRLAPAPGRRIAPHPVHQPVDRHHPAGLDGQRREQAPLPGRPERHRPGTGERGHLAQHAHDHGHQAVNPSQRHHRLRRPAYGAPAALSCELQKPRKPTTRTVGHGEDSCGDTPHTAIAGDTGAMAVHRHNGRGMTMTVEDLKAVVESQGGVDMDDLREYAESCWNGC